MNGDREKAAEQLLKVSEAMHSVKVLDTWQSRYELCMELLKLSALVTTTEEKLLRIREQYGLVSAVWILAEVNYYSHNKEN